MNPLAINTQDCRFQKGGGARQVKAPQDGSFAGMLKKGSTPDTAPAPVSDKTGPPQIPPDIQSRSKGKADATDNSLQTAPINGAPFVSPLEENKTPAVLIDEAAILNISVETPAALVDEAAILNISVEIRAALVDEAAVVKVFVEAPPSALTQDIMAETAHMKASAAVAADAHRQGAHFSMLNTFKEELASPKHETSFDRAIKIGSETPSASSEGTASPRVASQAELQNEPAFTDRIAALLQQREDGLAPDKIFSEDRRTFFLKQNENLTTISKAALPATALQTGLQKEPAIMDRIAALLQPGQDGFSSEDIDSQTRRSAVFTRSNHAVHPPKAALPATAVQNSFAADTGEGELATKMVRPEQAVTMREDSPAVMGPLDHSDKSRHSTPARVATAAERVDAFPLRIESLNTPGPLESRAPLSDILPGNRTQAVINQLLEARQAMQGDFGRIRIVLTPPNLGTVDLQIFMHKERVEVLMTTDNSSVQQALLSRADDIRSALQRQDLKIENFQVLLEDQTANQRQTDGGAMFQQHQEHQVKQNVKDSDPVPSIGASIFSNETSNPASGGVSIFA